ncbi:MAG: 2-iminoacetate synthase ThiH [Fusobacteriota bacterium]
MTFFDELKTKENFNIKKYFNEITDSDIINSLDKENKTEQDFLNLLSPKASSHLREMAYKSKKLTKQHFGNTVLLYLPMYISNYCDNNCLYCGFSYKNKISRKRLTFEEIKKEAEIIQNMGIRHILILTGESPKKAGFDFIKESIKVLKNYFDSISIEIYPMKTEKYSELKKIGVDGLTIYQEVYDEKIYKQVHLQGKKSDYRYRLETPERGAEAGIQSVNIGTLFGLGDIYREAFLSGLHAKYLMDKYINTEISISLPRINHAEGNFKPKYKLDEKRYIQFLFAYRLFMPKVGINISTREKKEFRDKLLHFGITKFSAGSKTEVGGYNQKDKSTPQFEISDKRSTKKIILDIKKQGFQPIFKNWERI